MRILKLNRHFYFYVIKKVDTRVLNTEDMYLAFLGTPTPRDQV